MQYLYYILENTADTNKNLAVNLCIRSALDFGQPLDFGQTLNISQSSMEGILKRATTHPFNLRDLETFSLFPGDDEKKVEDLLKQRGNHVWKQLSNMVHWMGPPGKEGKDSLLSIHKLHFDMKLVMRIKTQLLFMPSELVDIILLLFSDTGGLSETSCRTVSQDHIRIKAHLGEVLPTCVAKIAFDFLGHVYPKHANCKSVDANWPYRLLRKR